ncbi:hypothetical protein KOR34_09230 [Posidoniimonas corsicana]|uniref:Matrixin n=1 Tax=Posidoniimonas corsicana TaxID=1938618 RepID=A0A5C5VEC5_9BACT|nr:hypothetical protein [Posidoniimonas corsicana]TWT36025.1 hypothetical protein KOR34_09230 [Posidoniimonas corsicana]
MTWPRPAGPLLLLLAAAIGAAPVPSTAVNLRIDYSQDGSGFFSASTSQGQQARTAVEAAADYYSAILEDQLSPVSVPARFFGVGGGTANFYLQFADPNHPTDASRAVSLASYDFAQDEYVVFVGGAALAGSQIASAGVGGSSYDYRLFTQSDVTQVEQIYEAFVADYETRGQSSGFAHWGGTISFDNDGSTTWNRDVGSLPGAGETDLYSVALHELGHALGFGSATLQSEGLVDGANRFIGAAAVNEYGGPVPLNPAAGHWAEGVTSTILGSVVPQEALFDPSFNGPVRKELTALDAAGLADLGWSVVVPEGIAGDFNRDGAVNAADYTVWRDGLGGAYSQADYLVWRQAYPASGAEAAAYSAAPAPSSLLTLVPLAAFALGPGVRRASVLRR